MRHEDPHGNLNANRGLIILATDHEQACIGVHNEKRELFTEFCTFNNLVIGGTVFPHKEIHVNTSTSPDDRTENQIDTLTIDRKWRRSMTSGLNEA